MDPTSTTLAAGSGAGNVSPTGSATTINAKARKRTKTGCLTCRKRRIKCGEERPTCANCIKSKRQCEGYNQRVVFKPPIGDWPNHPGVVTNLQYHNSMLPGTRTSFRPAQPSSQVSEATLGSIQPRPLTHFDYQSESAPVLGSLNTHQPYRQDGNFGQPLTPPQLQQQTLQSPQHQLPTPTSATSYYPQNSPLHNNFHGQYAQESPRYPPNHYSTQSSHDQSYYTYGSQSQAPLRQPQVTTASYSQAEAYALAVSHPDSSNPSFQPVQIPQHDVSPHVTYMPQHTVYDSATVPAAKDHMHFPTVGFKGVDHLNPTQALDEAAIEAVDDDYWDVDSEEESVVPLEASNEEATIFEKDLSLIRKVQYEHTSEVALRRYDAFIYEGILASYRAEHVANPLKNPQTARVFAHFIHVTGPSLSIYERNPRNPTSMFEGPTPPSQQNLWTYILPLKALNHQGLLHAMLALASLHIARLQQASATPSYKHYAYALKRLGRSLSNPERRHTIATLATSLLLAFYEVMTAEHVKWSTHLVGAAQLLLEFDFASLTEKAQRLRVAQEAQERNSFLTFDQCETSPVEHTPIPDEALISQIMGEKIVYNGYGRILDCKDSRNERKPHLSGKLDLKTFETLQDLQWFYMRHDAFQSMVSGNPLITPFQRWADCPPRSPLGCAGAIYGTHDHIVLLLARISDFAVRDRPRKLKQVEANGGQWKPSPKMPGGMPMAPPHGQGANPPSRAHQTQHEQQEQCPRGPPPEVPSFYGMAPSHGPSSLPKRYAASSPPSSQPPRAPPDPHRSPTELSAATAAAEQEWQQISLAHATIARILASTEAFAPLTEDLYPAAPGGNTTPFGPVLVHRSYDISTLWMTLHLAAILLLRSHPAMPPAAIMAAGVAEHATRPYATLIGRIAAGMQVPASDDVPLSPFLGAALIEATMGLFFAGVQYQETNQRKWLIQRLLAIDRRTGWASAAVIARSCETMWEKSAEAGRGPPYTKRKTRPHGEKGSIVLDGHIEGGWGGSGVVRGRGEPFASAEGNVSTAVGKLRVPWAKNLLASEEELRVDMARMGLGGYT